MSPKNRGKAVRQGGGAVRKTDTELMRDKVILCHGFQEATGGFRDKATQGFPNGNGAHTTGRLRKGNELGAR